MSISKWLTLYFSSFLFIVMVYDLIEYHTVLRNVKVRNIYLHLKDLTIHSMIIIYMQTIEYNLIIILLIKFLLLSI